VRLPETNDAIDRCGKGFRPDAKFYRTLAERIREAGIRLKINTVINRLNLSENLGDLVAELLPFRRKLFQVKRVIGQNDKTFAELVSSVAEFEDFVVRNRRLVPSSVAVVPETADDMTASYAMIAPNGCFFDSARGSHRYSMLHLFQVRHKECWDDFVKWSEAEDRGGKSLLLTYGLWLAQRHGQRELLLPKCDAFAAKLDSLTPK